MTRYSVRFCSFCILFRHSGAFLLRLGDEIPQLDQVETAGGQAEVEFDLLKPCIPELAESSYHLGPAEEFFDLLAILQALTVAGMPGGAAIYRRTFLLAGNMQSDIEFPHVLDMVKRFGIGDSAVSVTCKRLLEQAIKDRKV